MKLGLLLALSLAFSACSGAAVNKSTNNASAKTNSTNANSTPTVTAAKVTIDSPDGVKLISTYLPASKPNSPALLLLHQWQSDRHSYDDFAKQMHERGFAVLAIDGRGFGESTKKADGSTVAPGRTDADVKAMLGDVDAAYNYLAKQPNVDASKIGLVGASYGSSLAIIYAADHSEVAAVALLSPGRDYFGNMPTEPAVEKYGNRPLFMVAANDDAESASAVKKLGGDGSNQNYQTKIYEKGGHGTALFKVGLAYELGKFLSSSLQK
jgi:dienelactone hydrolase